MRATLTRSLRSAVVAAVALLCLLSPAQAIVYRGTWDPVYGLPFVGVGSPVGFDLGWRGTVQVFVPDGCELGAGFGLFTPSPCKSGSQLTNAHVELYDATTDTKRGDLYFDSSNMSVLSLHFSGGELSSLTTLPSDWIQPQWLSPEAASPYFSLLFVDADTSNLLRFLFAGLRDEIPAGYFGPLLLSHPTRDFVDLRIDSLGDLFDLLRDFGSISVSDVQSNPPEFPNGRLFVLDTPQLAPEPGSLVLVAVALLATGWARSSRRRR